MLQSICAIAKLEIDANGVVVVGTKNLAKFLDENQTDFVRDTAYDSLADEQFVGLFLRAYLINENNPQSTEYWKTAISKCKSDTRIFYNKIGTVLKSFGIKQKDKVPKLPLSVDTEEDILLPQPSAPIAIKKNFLVQPLASRERYNLPHTVGSIEDVKQFLAKHYPVANSAHVRIMYHDGGFGLIDARTIADIPNNSVVRYSRDGNSVSFCLLEPSHNSPSTSPGQSPKPSPRRQNPAYFTNFIPMKAVKKNSSTAFFNYFVPSYTTALIIANSNYNKATGLEHLSSAMDDRVAIDSYLINYSKRIPLLNQSADKIHIYYKSLLEDIKKRSESENVLIFLYYSGHGVEIGSDTFGLDCDKNLFPLTSFVDQVKEITNVFIVAVLDCCRTNLTTTTTLTSTATTTAVTTTTATGTTTTTTTATGPKPGQSCIVYATKPGGNAIATKASFMTTNFLEHIKKFYEIPFPLCINNWGRANFPVSLCCFENVYLDPQQ